MAEHATEPDLEPARAEAELIRSGPGEVEDASEAPEPEPEPELSPEARRRRSEALAHVRVFGDPVLRSRARAVDRFDDALQEEVERMGRLMNDAIGVGLAATQVGVMHRLLVYRVHQQAPVAALVNPRIEWAGEETEALEEGCLSLPGVQVDVDRSVHVRVSAQNERGEPIVVEAAGLEARVIQHEIDHLDGILILDRVAKPERKQAMKDLRAALADERR